MSKLADEQVQKLPKSDFPHLDAENVKQRTAELDEEQLKKITGGSEYTVSTYLRR